MALRLKETTCVMTGYSSGRERRQLVNRSGDLAIRCGGAVFMPGRWPPLMNGDQMETVMLTGPPGQRYQEAAQPRIKLSPASVMAGMASMDPGEVVQ